MLKKVCHPHYFYQKNCQMPVSIILIFKITLLINKKVRKNLNSGLFLFFSLNLSCVLHTKDVSYRSGKYHSDRSPNDNSHHSFSDT